MPVSSGSPAAPRVRSGRAESPSDASSHPETNARQTTTDEIGPDAVSIAPQAIRRGLNVNNVRAAPSGAAGG